MTSMRVGCRVAASALACALMGTAMWHPQILPGPAQRGLARAVDGTARVLLWMWDEPTDALDNPGAQWHAAPSAWGQTGIELIDSDRLAEGTEAEPMA